MKTEKRKTVVAKKLQEKTHYVGFQMPVNLYKHYQKASSINRRSFSAEIICALEDAAIIDGYERDLAY